MSRPVMQRPVMDPLFLEQLKAPPPRLRWLRAVGRAVLWVGGKLLSHPLSTRSSRLKFQQETLGSRLIRGAAYRSLFIPVALAGTACALVYTGTHPREAAAIGSGDPRSTGIYHEPVEMAAEDGVKLAGWLVPVVDARRVMLHRDRLFTHTYPAVVLVHDHGHALPQMLPLVGPLHDDGIVVMAVGLRGAGTKHATARTFGLAEAGDVLAAVNALRGRPFVDADRICVVGVGTGANAAVLAAGRDPKIRALVLADPVVDAGELVARRLGPDRDGLRWMQPVTKWAFEVAYQTDIDELSLSQHQTTLATRTLLRVEQATADGRLLPGPVEQIRTFCRETLKPWGK